MTTRGVRTRPAAVAGTFYPSQRDDLEAALRESFAAARQPGDDAPAPKALIVPHAGYAYSGPVAASAYLRLRPAHSRIRRVVVLGPNHRVPLRGIAVSGADDFETPLGEVRLDAAARSTCMHLPFVAVNDAAHALEHSIEVQLPFLQVVLDDFELLPLLVGQTHFEEVEGLITTVWGGEDTLVVISTDLSHYLPFREARSRDARTASSVLTLSPEDLADHDACGYYPLRGLLGVARERSMRVELLDLRSSGDTGGDRERVVGYGAFALT